VGRDARARARAWADNSITVVRKPAHTHTHAHAHTRTHTHTHAHTRTHTHTHAVPRTQLANVQRWCSHGTREVHLPTSLLSVLPSCLNACDKFRWSWRPSRLSSGTPTTSCTSSTIMKSAWPVSLLVSVVSSRMRPASLVAAPLVSVTHVA
jgi:hypothetical protein